MRVEPELILEPMVDGLLSDVLAEPERLSTMVEALGSPLNVVVPERIAENAEKYRALYHTNLLRAQSEPVQCAHPRVGGGTMRSRRVLTR
jgi:diaminopimelate decarboxylase